MSAVLTRSQRYEIKRRTDPEKVAAKRATRRDVQLAHGPCNLAKHAKLPEEMRS